MLYAMQDATENSHIIGDCDWIWWLIQHQRTCQTRNYDCTDTKNAQELLIVEALRQNSVTIEDNLTGAKYIWGRCRD